jgi:hypothetical protein
MKERIITAHDGRTMTFIGGLDYVYLDKQPCIRVRVRGDIDLDADFRDAIILKVEEAADVSIVWYAHRDADLAKTTAELCALYARQSKRFSE